MSAATQSPIPELLTIPQTAKHLNISTSTVYRMLSNGELNSVKLGKRSRRIKSSEVSKLIQAGEVIR